MIAVRGNRWDLHEMKAHIEESGDYLDDSVEWPTVDYFLLIHDGEGIIRKESLDMFDDYSDYERSLKEVAEEFGYGVKYEEE